MFYTRLEIVCLDREYWSCRILHPFIYTCFTSFRPAAAVAGFLFFLNLFLSDTSSLFMGLPVFAFTAGFEKLQIQGGSGLGLLHGERKD